MCILQQGGLISRAFLFIILSLINSFGLFLLNSSSKPSTFITDILFANRLAITYLRPHSPRHTHYLRHYGLHLKARSRLPTRLNPPHSHRNHTFYHKRYIKQKRQQEHSTPNKNLVPDQWGCEHTPLAQCLDSYHHWIHMESRILGLDQMFPSLPELELALLSAQHGTSMDEIVFHHDPLHQLKTIQLLCSGSFLNTTYKCKKTQWKHRIQQCMVAAATLSQTNNLTSITRSMDHINLANTTFTDLSKRMSIYLNGNGDDLLLISSLTQGSPVP